MQPTHAFLLTFRDTNCPDQHAASTILGIGRAMTALDRKFPKLANILIERLPLRKTCKDVALDSKITYWCKKYDATNKMVDQYISYGPDRVEQIRNTLQDQCWINDKLEVLA